MLEKIFRSIFDSHRPRTVEIIARLEKKFARNERVEHFLYQNALRFQNDPKNAMKFVFHVGIVYGWLLSGNRNKEIEDFFDVDREISEEEKMSRIQ